MWYIIANTILIILFSIIGYWIGRYDRENKTKEYMQKYYEARIALLQLRDGE